MKACKTAKYCKRRKKEIANRNAKQQVRIVVETQSASAARKAFENI